MCAKCEPCVIIHILYGFIRYPMFSPSQTLSFCICPADGNAPAAILDSLFPLSRHNLPTRPSTPFPSSPSCLSTLTAKTEYVDTFDGYSFKYPQCWIQVRGAGADIFFRDPYILDENLSVEFSSPSSSGYKTVEDLGPPQEAGKKVLKQYLIEFLSTRLGVRRESNVLSTSSRVADDGKLYYQVEVKTKSFANSNELAVMPQVRVPDWNGTGGTFQFLELKTTGYMSCDYKTPESVFVEEENELEGSGGWLIGFLTLRFFLGMRFFFFVVHWHEVLILV